MLNSIRFSRSMLRCWRWMESKRTFLSEAYSCTEAWSRRHESPLLSKINPRNMYGELDQRFQANGKVSAVDVDIYANNLEDPEGTNELLDIIYQLRMSAETSNTLDSTHHAIIKFLLNSNQKELLLEILDDRLHYGIFPDHLLYNIMMDKFIKENDFGSAAKIASLLMLQEDSDHPIANALAVYSCHKFLEDLKGWPVTSDEQKTEDETEEKKVIKIRVDYVRNPYFDDHFDLRDCKQIVGKTLVFFGKLVDNPVGRTCHLRGLILWGKYDKACELIKSWMDKDLKDIIYRDTLSSMVKEVSEIPEDKVTDDVAKLKDQLNKLESCTLKDGSIVEEMERRIVECIKEKEQSDISNQCQIYENWEKHRMELLEKQLADIDKQKRIERIESIKKDLKERERLLTFFENEEKLELAIENKLAWEEEKYGPVMEVKENDEETYVPPVVQKQHKVTK